MNKKKSRFDNSLNSMSSWAPKSLRSSKRASYFAITSPNSRANLRLRCASAYSDRNESLRFVTGMIATTSNRCLDSYCVEERRLSVEGHEGDGLVNTKPSVSIRQVPGRPTIHTNAPSTRRQLPPCSRLTMDAGEAAALIARPVASTGSEAQIQLYSRSPDWATSIPTSRRSVSARGRLRPRHRLLVFRSVTKH